MRSSKLLDIDILMYYLYTPCTVSPETYDLIRNSIEVYEREGKIMLTEWGYQKAEDIEDEQ